jgi:hypothetical protein
LISGIILTPIDGENQTLSRNFTLGEKGSATLEMEWDWKRVEIDRGRIAIVELGQNKLVTYQLLSKTQQFSNMDVELNAGKYQITLCSTHEGTLINAILKTNQGWN